MLEHILRELDLPEDFDQLRLLAGVDQRLQKLLDRQDSGNLLATDERPEAEGLIHLAELFSRLRLRVQRLSEQGSRAP